MNRTYSSKVTMGIKRRISLLMGTIATVLFSAITTAQASTIFSDFGTGNSYNATFGYTVSGSGSFVGLAQTAMSFTPSDDFILMQIDLAITGTNSVMLTLDSDAGGLPGGVITSWVLTNLPFFGSCCLVETVTPGSPVSLTAGTQYWLVASTTGSTIDTWNLNTIGSTGLFAQNSGSGFVAHTGDLGAFDVLGVPEPATTAMAAGGLIVIAILRRRLV